MKLLYKFPSRSRPNKFFNSLDNINSMAKHEDYLIVATLDENDRSMNNEIVKQRIAGYPKVTVDWGISKSKIHAVNRGLWKFTDWDILIATSDDMEYVTPGFDLQIIEDMQANFPDGDGVLHYPDGFDHGDILSLPIMSKKYFDRFGYIYHPSYQSLFCDEEAIIVAKQLGKVFMSDKLLFKHMHPAWGAAANDQQYKHTESFHPIDKKVFQNRTARNFPK